MNSSLRPDLRPPARPRPAIAFVLGLLAPGLGHLYAASALAAVGALVAWCALILPAVRLTTALVSWSPGAVAAGLGLAVVLLLLVPAHGALAARPRAGRRPPPRRGVAIHLAWALAATLVLLAVNRWTAERFWVRVLRVPSVSMSPTLVPGDFVLADMRRGTAASVGPGDVVVYDDLADPPTFYIKRLAAGAGQAPPDGIGAGAVPEGYVWVVGDNRERSIDSRREGPLARDRVRGRVYRVLLSRDPESGRIRWERSGRSVAAP